MCNDCTALIKAIDRYIAKADDDLEKALEAEGYIEPKATVKYITAIEEGVAETLTAETQYIVTEMEKAVDLAEFVGEAWEQVKENDGLAIRLYRIFKGQFKTFMPHYVNAYIQAVDAELRLGQMSQRTIAWVDSWSRQLGELMQLSSHRELDGILKKALESGQSIAETTRQLQESGIRDEYYKARRAALTEVLRAHSVSHQEAQMQSPAVVSKRWRHSGTKKITPRKNHQIINGQTVPKDKPYTLWADDGMIYYPMYPRDPELPPSESVNCHCISQSVVDDKILGMPLEERQRLQQEAVAKMDDDWERELSERNKLKGISHETDTQDAQQATSGE